MPTTRRPASRMQLEVLPGAARRVEHDAIIRARRDQSIHECAMRRGRVRLCVVVRRLGVVLRRHRGTPLPEPCGPVHERSIRIRCRGGARAVWRRRPVADIRTGDGFARDGRTRRTMAGRRDPEDPRASIGEHRPGDVVVHARPITWSDTGRHARDLRVRVPWPRRSARRVGRYYPSTRATATRPPAWRSFSTARSPTGGGARSTPSRERRIVASNALCRKFGFELIGEETIDYGGRALRCNHWVLDPTDGTATAEADTAAQR